MSNLKNHIAKDAYKRDQFSSFVKNLGQQNPKKDSHMYLTKGWYDSILRFSIIRCFRIYIQQYHKYNVTCCNLSAEKLSMYIYIHQIIGMVDHKVGIIIKKVQYDATFLRHIVFIHFLSIEKFRFFVFGISKRIISWFSIRQRLQLTLKIWWRWRTGWWRSRRR